MSYEDWAPGLRETGGYFNVSSSSLRAADEVATGRAVAVIEARYWNQRSQRGAAGGLFLTENEVFWAAASGAFTNSSHAPASIVWQLADLPAIDVQGPLTLRGQQIGIGFTIRDDRRSACPTLFIDRKRPSELDLMAVRLSRAVNGLDALSGSDRALRDAIAESGMGALEELWKLRSALAPDELVFAICSGSIRRYGLRHLVAVTSESVIVIGSGSIQRTPIDDVVQVVPDPRGRPTLQFSLRQGSLQVSGEPNSRSFNAGRIVQAVNSAKEIRKVRAQAQPDAAGSGDRSPAERLREMQRLHKEGVLNDEEFLAHRERILALL